MVSNVFVPPSEAEEDAQEVEEAAEEGGHNRTHLPTVGWMHCINGATGFVRG